MFSVLHVQSRLIMIKTKFVNNCNSGIFMVQWTGPWEVLDISLGARCMVIGECLSRHWVGYLLRLGLHDYEENLNFQCMHSGCTAKMTSIIGKMFVSTIPDYSANITVARRGHFLPTYFHRNSHFQSHWNSTLPCDFHSVSILVLPSHSESTLFPSQFHSISTM